MDDPFYIAGMSDHELREARDAADAQVQRYAQMGDTEMLRYWREKSEQFDNEMKRRAR